MKESLSVSRESIAQRVARNIPPGAVINLGIGMPELVSNFLSAEKKVIIHTENGVIGSGPIVQDIGADYDLINAGGRTVSLLRGGHFVDHATSFAMIRGGHLDVSVMGAFQVSSAGDLANWSTGDSSKLPSPGGAMDLAIGAKQVFVMMNFFDKDQKPKLVPRCTMPITASQVVTKLFTDIATFDLTTPIPSVIDINSEFSLEELSKILDMELARP